MIEEIANAIIKCFENGGKLLICGNGGSSSQADHLVGELVGKFELERRALPAISLNNISVITAIANDYSYDGVFFRQIEALGNKGDVLITLSTSGTSENIIQAQNAAFKKKMVVIRFPTNQTLGTNTAKTQEKHLEMIHEISRRIEKHFA